MKKDKRTAEPPKPCIGDRFEEARTEKTRRRTVNHKSKSSATSLRHPHRMLHPSELIGKISLGHRQCTWTKLHVTGRLRVQPHHFSRRTQRHGTRENFNENHSLCLDRRVSMNNIPFCTPNISAFDSSCPNNFLFAHNCSVLKRVMLQSGMALLLATPT